MSENIIKYLKSSIAISILLIIFSIFLIFAPEASLSLIMRILGIILIFIGLLHIINYFSEFKEFKTISIQLIIGVLTFIIGFSIIFKPLIVNDILMILIGSWIIIESVIKFQISLKRKVLGSDFWLFPFLFSIVSFIIGILVLFNPFETMLAITTICGISLLISEICNIIEDIYILKNILRKLLTPFEKFLVLMNF